jgi:hypothetical protein
VEKAQHDLATARASEAAASSASLLTRLDAPLADDRPLGPGRARIVLVGMLGGLATGLGLLFLTTPMTRQWGRRCTDYLLHGRRSSDRNQQAAGNHAGRRTTDSGRDRRAEDGPPLNRRATDLPPRRRASDAAPECRTVPPISPERIFAEPAPMPQPAATGEPPAFVAPAKVRPAGSQANESLSLVETLMRLSGETKRS